MLLNYAVKSKIFAVAGLLCSAFGVWAQSSAFTYQGQLISNSIPATGQFDLRFALFNDLSAGSQIGSPLTNSPTGVTNGLFLVTLDFGSSVFDGGQRWLEIGVRTNGSTNVFTTLAPRQLLTATPYAVRAANYTGILGATNITGKINDLNLSANVALLTNNATFLRTVTASNFVGNGFGLSNLPAPSLTGTIADARLSTNVALLNLGTNAFLGSLSATNFYGFGGGLTNVPGRLFDFVPTATSLTAQGNYGYLATNDTTPVTITLPPTLNIPVGSTVRVSGSGAAGWIIAQQAGQTILSGQLLNNAGINWRTNSSGLSLKAITSSADGRKLAVAVASGNIFTSTDYGVNWVGRASALNWSAIASSADGAKLVASVNGAYIWTSTDSGTNWTQRTTAGARAWTGVASSLDGSRLVACVSGVGVFYSTDSGASWPQGLSLAQSFTGVAVSADGSNVVAVAQGGQVYLSSNGGASGTWSSRETGRSWTCVAASADGGVLVAGVNSVNPYLFVSTDAGVTWTPGTVSAAWAGVACSADGSRMIAVANGGGVYVSQDTGLSWQIRSLPTTPNYTGAACSSDGSTMAAVASATAIYVSSKATTTTGTTGGLVGSRLSAVELQHIGNGVFFPVNFVGNIRVK